MILKCVIPVVRVN